jgi:hypothetical protein
MDHQTVSSEFPARRVLPEQELASKPAIRDLLTVVDTGQVITGSRRSQSLTRCGKFRRGVQPDRPGITQVASSLAEWGTCVQPRRTPLKP